MKQITSLQNQLVKNAVALQQKKYRDETALFLVEGEEPCRAAIERGWGCLTLFVNEKRQGASKHQEAGMVVFSGMAKHVVFVIPEILEKISKKSNPQDVIGVFRQRLYQSPRGMDFHLALEEIRDPGNLGTIMRTAHAVGVKSIILVGECCDAFSPEVIRASAGSFSFAQLSEMNQDEFLRWQAGARLRLLGTDVAEAVDYRKADFTDAVLVMGNEQKGLSPALKARCNARVHIPMPGGTESLNLSVATGLLLYAAMQA